MKTLKLNSAEINDLFSFCKHVLSYNDIIYFTKCILAGLDVFILKEIKEMIRWFNISKNAKLILKGKKVELINRLNSVMYFTLDNIELEYYNQFKLLIHKLVIINQILIGSDDQNKIIPVNQDNRWCLIQAFDKNNQMYKWKKDDILKINNKMINIDLFNNKSMINKIGKSNIEFKSKNIHYILIIEICNDDVNKIELLNIDYNSISNDLINKEIISLMDPISLSRIKIPMRSIYCKHLSCFDFYSMINFLRSNNYFCCPICNKKINDIYQLYVDTKIYIFLKYNNSINRIIIKENSILPDIEKEIEVIEIDD